MSYDIKFKQRVIEYREEGNIFKETCKVFKISGQKYKRINIVAGKCGDKIISPLVYDKIMDSKFF